VSREELPLRGGRLTQLTPNFFFYSNQVFFSKKNLSFAIFVCCACCFAIQNCVTHDFQGFSAIVWFSSNQKEKFFHFKF
jgi:hypothetical protein